MNIDFFLHQLIIIGIYFILTVSLNLALGYTGLLNLGHVAFFGIGAYASALLTSAGFPFLAALVLAGLIASLTGLMLVYATRRLKGDYLALATLGFSFVVYSLMLNWVALTRGPQGIPGISKPALFGLSITTNQGYFLLVALISAVSIYIMYRIVRSPFGTLLEATRDDELGLRVLGKNTYVLKYKAMMISAFFAGIAGSLLAHYLSYIDPGTFYINELILVLTIVIVGGIASVRGTLLATVIIVLIPEILRFLALPSAVLGPGREMVYALILLAILMFRPRGLFGRVDIA